MPVEVFFRARCAGPCGQWVGADDDGNLVMVKLIPWAVEFGTRRIMRDKLEEFGLLSGSSVYCGFCAWDSAT